MKARLTWRGCTEVSSVLANGGVFTIKASEIGAVEVYCDTETDGGGWTVSDCLPHFEWILDFVYVNIRILHNLLTN